MRATTWTAVKKEDMEALCRKLGVQAEVEYEDSTLKSITIGSGMTRLRISPNYSSVSVSTVKEPTEKRYVLHGMAAGIKIEEQYPYTDEAFSEACDRKSKLEQIRSTSEKLEIDEREIPISKLTKTNQKEKAA